MKIKAKDIADKLGISAATVSMVLNHKPGISEETRALVIEEAKRCGFDFSKVKISSTGTIFFIIYKKHGKVVSDTPFFAQVIEGLENACRKSGYRLQILYHSEHDDPENLFTLIRNNGCCGIVLLGTEMYVEDYLPFQHISLPIVILDSYYDSLNFSTILINNMQGAFQATSHLIEQGHTNIGYLASATEISNFQERADGFFKALRVHNIRSNQDYIFHVTPTLEDAYREFSQILDRHPKLPTCFFADNDIIAMGCMRALREHNYHIPEDISIIGFDDMPACQILNPPLTTSHVPKQLLGEYAIYQLLALVTDPSRKHVKIELSTDLIIRQSVANLNTAFSNA